MMRERANKVDVEMPKRPERRGSVIYLESAPARTHKWQQTNMRLPSETA
jgi:hypothetical protein